MKKKFLAFVLVLCMSMSITSLAFATNVEDDYANKPIECRLIPLPEGFVIGVDEDPVLDENSPELYNVNTLRVWLTNVDANNDGKYEVAKFTFDNINVFGVFDPIDSISIQVIAYKENNIVTIPGGPSHTREFALYRQRTETFQATPYYIRGKAYIFGTEAGETKAFLIELPSGNSLLQ